MSEFEWSQKFNIPHHEIFQIVAAAQLISQLCSDGYSMIGSGDDAVVFSQPNDNTAIRIGLYPDTFNYFVNAIAREKSLHFPKIHSQKMLGEFSVTIMEKLDHVEDTDSTFWSRVNSTAALAYCLADDRPLTDQTDWLQPSLIRFARFVAECAKEQNFTLDLNKYNVLRRVDSREIVFTDIFCRWGD